MKTLFVGDISPTSSNSGFFKAKDINKLFSDTLSLFEGNDINMINLECALTDSDSRIAKIGPALKGPKETAEVLRNYLKRQDRHIDRLYSYAKKLHCESIVRTYLEVLVS